MVKNRQPASIVPQTGGEHLLVHQAVTVWINGIKAGDSQAAQEL
ncbi:MAG: hypothetical protein VB858_11240 [Planctomycetaceae bacterium]